MNRLTVRLPWTPPASLNPNRRRQHRYATDERNQARAAGYYGTRDAMPDDWRPSGGRICYTVTVAWGKGRRRLDDDNLLMCLKPCRDGISDALGVDDRWFAIRGVEQIRDRDGAGYTEFALWPE